VACIVRPQGRRGEVTAEILTDFPERFQSLRSVFLERPGDAPQAARVEKAWLHKGRIVLKLDGVDSISGAEALRGLHVLIRREERIPLGEAQYYRWELEGCRVILERKSPPEEIGTVTSVEPTGGVDLLHVATPRGEVLIPLAQDICTRIDPEKKTIVIDPPEDLLELNQ
jgi:16S rRNA processing protein RimM